MKDMLNTTSSTISKIDLLDQDQQILDLEKKEEERIEERGELSLEQSTEQTVEEYPIRLAYTISTRIKQETAMMIYLQQVHRHIYDLTEHVIVRGLINNVFTAYDNNASTAEKETMMNKLIQKVVQLEKKYNKLRIYTVDHETWIKTLELATELCMIKLIQRTDYYLNIQDL